MSQRIRTVQKLGKGKYYTSSWKVSDYLIANICYYIFIFPIYAFCKWCLYMPIKWCILKIIELIKNKKSE